MGTRLHLILPGVDEDVGHRVFQQIKKETERVERKLSRFEENSDISRLNKQAWQKTAKVDEELFDVLMACKTCWEVTNGAFDPTLRPLMDYKERATDEEVPYDDFERLQGLVGMHHIDLDETQQTVSFENEIIEIDLGGFGKGYALEKISDILKKSPVQRAFISFGESSVLTVGDHPAGGSWRIGIQDYLNPGQSIYEFRIGTGSISTSANFYVDDAGSLNQHPHIINPKTGKVDEDCKSVSVTSTSPLLAEMLSTAFLVMDSESVQQIKQRYDGLEIVMIDYSTGEPEITHF